MELSPHDPRCSDYEIGSVGFANGFFFGRQKGVTVSLMDDEDKVEKDELHHAKAGGDGNPPYFCTLWSAKDRESRPFLLLSSLWSNLLFQESQHPCLSLCLNGTRKWSL